jgi:hypothetical protein
MEQPIKVYFFSGAHPKKTSYLTINNENMEVSGQELRSTFGKVCSRAGCLCHVMYSDNYGRTGDFEATRTDDMYKWTPDSLRYTASEPYAEENAIDEEDEEEI